MRIIALLAVAVCCLTSCGRAPSQSANSTVGAAPAKVASETDEYIAKYLKLYDLKARYEESESEGRLPGVTFKIKNEGDRTLDTVKVRVTFKDSGGRAIGEEDYSPVLYIRNNSGALVSGDNKPLRPGYIWQIERGKFFNAKSVPSEWKEGAVEARITDIEFAPD
jgi:hypothetical protein